jgi:hypothetical protein
VRLTATVTATAAASHGRRRTSACSDVRLSADHVRGRVR